MRLFKNGAHRYKMGALRSMSLAASMILSEKPATFRDHALTQPSRSKHYDQEKDDRNSPARRKPDEGGAAHPRPTGAAGRRNGAQRHLRN
jgi:hypothetical protein